MTSLSDYLEDKANQWVFRNTALAARGTGDIMVRLYTVTPSDTGGGTAVTGGSYADQLVPATSVYWNIPTIPAAVTNLLDINFPAATVSWGTIVAVGILDSTGTNLLFWGPILVAKPVAAGDKFSFKAGQLSISASEKPLVVPISGLVFGEGQLNEIRTPGVSPSIWADWSWGGTRNWSHQTTDPGQPFGAPYPAQQTVGPYGLKFDVTTGGSGGNAVYLHADLPYDTTRDRLFIGYIKKPNQEPMLFRMTDLAYAQVGNDIVVQQITGNVTSMSGRVLNDTSKAFIVDQLIGMTITITAGTGSGQSQKVFSNTATGITARFWWTVQPDATSQYRIDPFAGSGERMQLLAFTLRGTDIPGTLGNFNLPAQAQVANIYMRSEGASLVTIYLDEFQFLRQRDRYVPLVVGTRPEIRSYNNWSNYAPRYTTRYTGGGDLYHQNYASKVDGNCAGTTEEILEWASLKWFGDVRAAWTAASGPGDLLDLSKAICPLETGWINDAQQGWERWDDDSGVGTQYTLNTFGIGQAKIKYWPYYPHARLATAWSVDAHMSVVRYHFDWGTVLSDTAIDMTGLSLVNKLRRAVGAWESGSTLCDATHGSEHSGYARRALGGLCQQTTSGDNGRTFTGNIVSKPWLTMSDGDEFPYE